MDDIWLPFPLYSKNCESVQKTTQIHTILIKKRESAYNEIIRHLENI